MQIYDLLNNATATGAGPPVKVDHQRCGAGGGPIPMVLTGMINAQVVLEGTISSPDEVRLNTATWAPIENALWTANMADGLFVGFTHIRANVVSYVAGAIYFRALV